MIARVWKAWARPAEAQAYVRLFSETIIRALRDVQGFQRAEVFTRPAGDDEVEIMTMVHFADMNAIRAFAGDQPQVANVSAAARDLLIRFDREVVHLESAFVGVGTP